MKRWYILNSSEIDDALQPLYVTVVIVFSLYFKLLIINKKFATSNEKKNTCKDRGN